MMRTDPARAGGVIPWPNHPIGWRWAILLSLIPLLTFSSLARAEEDPGDAWTKVGQASWYGHEFDRRLTASGEPFNPGMLTGAHKTLPLGSRVRVTNLHNGRSVLVTINDRGPYIAQREIDLSYGAARVLGMLQRGIARVRIELLDL